MTVIVVGGSLLISSLLLPGWEFAWMNSRKTSQKAEEAYLWESSTPAHASVLPLLQISYKK